MKLMVEVQETIPFYPSIAKALGGIPEAIYFQHLYYWSKKGRRKDGFIYKTKKEIEEATTIKELAQNRIRNKLIKLGVLEVKKLRACGSPTLHYKINVEISQKIIDKYDGDLIKEDEWDGVKIPY